MTHAFFKALLFMAAGSIISAMANRQDIDRMSGFWKAMRFTSLMLLIGGLALAAFPLTSGFFSKDSILAYAEARGGMYYWMAIGGYVGAFLTALYTFRLIFRVLPGRPCHEAQELIETGHLHHGEPINPANEELEDPDVGFPGAHHHIAEQSKPMAVAMAVLAFGALFAGLIQVPGVDRRALRLPRAGLRRLAAEPRSTRASAPSGAAWRSAARSRCSASPPPTCSGCARPELPAPLPPAAAPRLPARRQQVVLRRADRLPVVRPALAIGRFANRTFERVVVDGLVNGTEDVVSAGGRVVRLVQSGFVRSYALLLIAGFAGLALYFLLVSS